MSKYNIIVSKNSLSVDTHTDINIEDFFNLSNGSIEQIICSDLDSISYDEKIKLIIAITKKISFNGIAVLKFFNIYKMCRDLVKGNISSKSISDVIEKKMSVLLESDVVDLVSQINHIRINKIYNSNDDIVVELTKIND